MPKHIHLLNPKDIFVKRKIYSLSFYWKGEETDQKRSSMHWFTSPISAATGTVHIQSQEPRPLSGASTCIAWIQGLDITCGLIRCALAGSRIRKEHPGLEPGS